MNHRPCSPRADPLYFGSLIYGYDSVHISTCTIIGQFPNKALCMITVAGSRPYLVTRVSGSEVQHLHSDPLNPLLGLS